MGLILRGVFLLQVFLWWSVGASDVRSLLVFKNGLRTSDPGGLLKSTWDSRKVDSSGCPLKWYGVSCSLGTVTSLQLNDLSLAGEIGLGTLGKLGGLTTLMLANNSLTGSLPVDFGDLGSLQVLDLSKNAFTGAIPDSLSRLRSVKNFSIAGNKFEGSISDRLFVNMSQLENLDLSRNSFSGSLPSSLSKLQGLVTLNVASNAFSGVISGDLRKLGSLQTLDLHENRLSGQVDPVLMGLGNLKYIDVSSNSLTGKLPWQQGSPMTFPQHIFYVNLSFNQFSGELAPEDATNLFTTSLQTLDVSNNLLYGKLPSFSFTFSIKVLRLQNNAFSGFVPSALFSPDSALEELDMSFNNLTGPLDTISSTNLATLKLGSNHLSGPLPIRFGTCGVVDLSNNGFSGNMSVMEHWGDGLQHLDLSVNSLSGVLPNETTHLIRLMYLNISHNKLSGSIPSFYASNYRKLTTLDLSANALEGPIPGEYFHSQSLSVLRLADNRLVGDLPIVNLISSTSLPGELLSPRSATSSSSPAAILFSPLEEMDFSSNLLSGTIPKEIASLAALQTINLSKNNLTGEIPAQLSLLRYLENLDLSFNNLTGVIPEHLPQSLVKLGLSENNLSGVIPSELWFKFGNASFFPGNAGLQLPAANSSDALSHQHKGVSTSLRNGLIGACVAVLVIVAVIVGYVFYKRRTSRFEIVEKRFEQRDIGPAPRFTNLPSLPPPAPRAKVSREHLLPVAQLSEIDPSDRVQDLERGSPSALDQSASLRTRSPDRLGGDLFIMDHTLSVSADELSSAPAEVLGRSSHGVSYKVTLASGRVVTVKWLKEELARDRNPFTREAKKLAAIQHPNIASLKGCYWGPKDHEKLVISDYLAHQSLGDWLSERNGRRVLPPLDWSQRLRIANDIARGLSHLHRMKIAHGNLKVTNVLLDGPGLVGRLSDYGLHQLMTPEGTANQILNAGALGYRAPELKSADNKKVKPTLGADIYALGVILLELVTAKGAGDIICGNAGAVDLTDWVKLLVSEGRQRECYDQTLQFPNGEEGEEFPRGIERFLALAVRCISERSKRPGIKAVQEELASVRDNL